MEPRQLLARLVFQGPGTFDTEVHWDGGSAAKEYAPAEVLSPNSVWTTVNVGRGAGSVNAAIPTPTSNSARFWLNSNLINGFFNFPSHYAGFDFESKTSGPQGSPVTVQLVPEGDEKIGDRVRVRVSALHTVTRLDQAVDDNLQPIPRGSVSVDYLAGFSSNGGRKTFLEGTGVSANGPVTPATSEGEFLTEIGRSFEVFALIGGSGSLAHNEQFLSQLTYNIIVSPAKPDLRPTALDVDYKNEASVIVPGVARIAFGQGTPPQALFALEATATIEALGSTGDRPFKVVFYSGATAGTKPGDPDYRELAPPVLVPSIAAGAKVDVEAELANPIFFTDASGGPLYANGYHIGVRVDSDNAIDEEIEINNTMTEDECDRTAAFLGVVMEGLSTVFLGLGYFTAYTNMQHYLAGSGEDLDYDQDSFASHLIAKSGVFQETPLRAAKDLLAGLMTIKGQSGKIPPNQTTTVAGLDLPLANSSRPYWGLSVIPPNDNDLALAIGGVQDTAGGPGASARFDGRAGVTKLGRKDMLTYDGEITFKFRDRYEFDNDDLGKSAFDFIARVLVHCGIARPYNAGYEVVVPIRGVIPVVVAGSSSAPTASSAVAGMATAQGLSFVEPGLVAGPPSPMPVDLPASSAKKKTR